MKTYCIKSVVFVVICCFTWILASPLRAKPVATLKGDAAVAKNVSFGPPVDPNAPLTHDKRTQTHITFVRDYVEVVDQRAFASAQAKVFDREPNQSYLWTLSVVSPSNEVLRQVVYDQQIFSVNLAQQVTPSFEDSIDLPPGVNYVQVALYRFPTGSGLDFLADDSKKNEYQMLRESTKVNLP